MSIYDHFPYGLILYENPLDRFYWSGLKKTKFLTFDHMQKPEHSSKSFTAAWKSVVNYLPKTESSTF